jgi:hypothetical protein
MFRTAPKSQFECWRGQQERRDDPIEYTHFKKLKNEDRSIIGRTRANTRSGQPAGNRHFSREAREPMLR